MCESDGHPGGGGDGSADAVLAALGAAVDRLATDDVAGLEDAVVLGRLVVVGRVIDQLEAERARLVAAAERSGALQRDGAATAGSWLRRHSSLPAGQASGRVRIGRRLGELPVIAAAFADGRLGLSHMAQIEGLCRDVGVAQVAAVQDELVEACDRLHDVDEFARLCKGWRHALRPDTADGEDDAAYERRQVALNATGDGTCSLSGVLDAEAGATLAAALSAFMTHDPPGTPLELRRSIGQRRCDALMDIARRALGDSDAPNVAGAKPRVVVRVTLRDLLALRGLLDDPAHHQHQHLPGRRTSGSAPTIDWVGPVGLSLVRRLLNDASVVRVVFDGDGRAVDVGTATRVWTTAIRTAITERDRGCRFDPCDRPAAWCDIDHVVPWPRGSTSADNGILLCRHHHRAKRRDGWWPTLHADGTVTWAHTDGRTRISPPPAHIDNEVDALLRAGGASGDAAVPYGSGDRGRAGTGAGSDRAGESMPTYDLAWSSTQHRPGCGHDLRSRGHVRPRRANPLEGTISDPAPAHHAGRAPPPWAPATARAA